MTNNNNTITLSETLTQFNKMSTKEKILFEMPDSFSRSEWMDKMSETGLSYSYSNQLLQDAVFSGDLERIDTGRYRKTAPEAETATA